MSTRRAAAGAGAGAAREFDVVMFAASSFTGIRAVEHVKRMQNRSLRGLSIAIAGRNEEKLRQVNEEAGTDLPIIIADTNDQASLNAMTARCKVLLTFAGPYTLYGMPVVDACAATRTHYVDITGEANFIRATVEKYHEQAVRDGVYFLSASAFDSLPVESAVVLLNREAKRKNIELKHVQCAWSMKSGKSGGAVVSGGTAASIFEVLKHSTAADAKPLSLVPESMLKPEHLAVGFPEVRMTWPSELFAGYTTPFLMSAINSKVVRKSNVLMGFKHSYVECARSSSFLTALGMWIMPYLFFALLLIPVLGPFLRGKLLPKPGQGPSREAEAEASFMVFGAAWTNSAGTGPTALRAKMVAPPTRGAGYIISGILPVEVAAAICAEEFNAEALDPNNGGWCGGGVVTPGAVVGDAVIRRLKQSDINFYVTESNSWKDSDMIEV